MLAVIEGFSVVWLVILVGWFVGRRNVLGENAPLVLSRLSFFLASPALLVETLAKADLASVFAEPLLVAAVSAVITGGAFLLIVKFWLKRSLAESLLSAMSSSTANAANLGIPIAAYVLGDAALIAPVLVFQLAFYTPFYLLLLDSLTSGRRATPGRVLLQIISNPMIVGTMVGLVLAATTWHLPNLVAEPLHLIAGAAIPAILIAFGMSLGSSKPLSAADGRRSDILLATAFKLILHPTVAFLLGHFALGMSGAGLFAVVVAAALPTAQNVYVTAQRYQVSVTVAKDTVLATTVLAIPAMFAVAFLLG
ncbi:AEC family transporter [Arthrobacter antibioticus]|uniref:AEC family transporter n=1 Tax=Arthrobacter sp. H35-MC1 TaxID=3046203 RepID=UPI0024B9736C|nr:AEC family transporter [Arthrobacter sp. H35-MC1]MDJ0318472.1 AEC family transporter [Arthrobacter sp. H35-MC1]